MQMQVELCSVTQNSLKLDCFKVDFFSCLHFNVNRRVNDLRSRSDHADVRLILPSMSVVIQSMLRQYTVGGSRCIVQHAGYQQ